MSTTLIHTIASLTLGGPGEPVEIETSAEARLAVASMARLASRSIEIVSRDLDPAVYDDAELVECIRDLVLASRHAQVRILVRDIGHVVKQGHRLVDLAKRLPSFLEIRAPAREHMRYNAAFFIADRVGTVFRTHADLYDGVAKFDDRRGAEELLRLFEDMWQAGEVPADLRRLSL